MYREKSGEGEAMKNDYWYLIMYIISNNIAVLYLSLFTDFKIIFKFLVSNAIKKIAYYASLISPGFTSTRCDLLKINIFVESNVIQIKRLFHQWLYSFFSPVVYYADMINVDSVFIQRFQIST